MKRLGLAVLLAATVPSAYAVDGVFFYDSTLPFTTTPMVHALRGAMPALVNVDQEFLNGDHRIRRIYTYSQRPYWGDYALDPALLFDIRDQNTDDPFQGNVAWEDMHQLTQRTVSGNCSGGTCRLSIPAMPAGNQLGLTGWKFQLTNGNEMDMRQLSIVPNPQGGYIDVTFTDDGGGHAYQVTVYYVELGAVQIQSITSRISTSPAHDSVTLYRSPGRAVLSGFRLRFTYGAHFLQRWSVELCTQQPSPTPCRDDQIRLRFRDIDGADDFDWWLRYTILHPES